MVSSKPHERLVLLEPSGTKHLALLDQETVKIPAVGVVRAAALVRIGHSGPPFRHRADPWGLAAGQAWCVIPHRRSLGRSWRAIMLVSGPATISFPIGGS